VEPLDRNAIALLLREIAAYLRLEREGFRARAYERAAALVETAPEFEQRLAEGRLESLPGIGPSLAGAIERLAAHGTLPLLERLRSRWPAGFVELLRVPGLGEKRARRLLEQLGIASVAELEAACRQGRVRALPGFGERSERALLAAIARPLPPKRSALLVVEARRLAEPLVAYLRTAPGATEVTLAGDVRRWEENVDAIEIAAATSTPRALIDHLDRHPAVSSAHAGDEELITRILAAGTPLTLHVASPERYGGVLVRATGSARHWEQLRTRAAERGLALEALAAVDETSFYAALGLPWLPPELRDGSDELASADAGDFAEPLVNREHVRGAVHCHTTWSDGRATIEEMARAAEALGLEYLTITDHSQSASYARGLTLDQLFRQWDEIDAVQARTPVRLFKGTEADILADGALDWPEDVLARLDVVIASVHRRHRQGEDEMTRRLVRALRQPVFKIWGHGLGRLVLHRDPVACRVDEVLDAAAAAPAAIELNGDPHRLDLPPELARRARTRGIPFVLSSDAHSTNGLRMTDHAVHMARRARLTPAEILNCLPAAEFAAAVKPAG
jgi:DNA polymerase (family 10)